MTEPEPSFSRHLVYTYEQAKAMQTAVRKIGNMVTFQPMRFTEEAISKFAPGWADAHEGYHERASPELVGLYAMFQTLAENDEVGVIITARNEEILDTLEDLISTQEEYRLAQKHRS